MTTRNDIFVPMSDSLAAASGSSPAAALHAALDELATVPLTRVSGDELIELWRDLERLRNRLAVVDHALIAEFQNRHLDHERGAANIKAFGRDVLRISAYEAGARARAAEAAGPRVSFTGEP